MRNYFNTPGQSSPETRLSTAHRRILTDRSALLALALAAAEAGRAVFPLSGKAPAIAGGKGCKDASTDRSRVHGLFNSAPDATGYGIATGAASRLVVVDIDGPGALREAKRRGLTSGYVVRTGRERDGWHLYFTIPAGVEVRTRDLAPDLELKADGAYVAAAGSVHPSGRRYRIARGGEPDPAPEWLLEPSEAEAEADATEEHVTGGCDGPVSIDVAGPEIPQGERNRTLARVAGRLHDASRSLAELERDLWAVNVARCAPPLGEREVRRIAASIHRREPCKPRPEVSGRVLAVAAYLEEAARGRAVRGMAGASGWAIYLAGLEALRRFGKEHPEGATLRLDMRTWAQMAGTEAGTVSRWVRSTPLVEVLERGTGRRASTVLFRCPEIGCQMQHSSTRGVSEEPGNGSVATNTLLRTLYRSRWTKRSRRSRSGLVSGTRRVRQGVKPRPVEGVARMGKSRAALLYLIRSNPGVSRSELARLKGVKPTSLTHPLRWLSEAGLIVRTSRGRYAPAGELARRVEDGRVLGGEPEADREQIARHERQREAYRGRHEAEADPAPEPGETRERRESYPERRRAHIADAIARLFAEHPEYRTRRVGQVVCKLPDYLAPDFPRGPDGLPKDAEVEALLEGVAA